MNLKLSMAALAALALVGPMAASALAQGAGPTGAQGGGAAQAGKGKRGQGPAGMRRRGGPMGFDAPVLAKLNLTSAQQTQVKALKDKLSTSMREAMEKNRAANGDREAMKKTLQGFTKQYREGLEKILTPAQQKQYKTLLKAEMEKRKKAMGERRRGGAGAPPPAL